ncbi:MAG: magnesium transporter [Candidatus Omnitrophica bacterium]|nr:magnesium transporter [Candidatus Omnitrophota bacterium]MBU1048329.1 magnesium transporter [Candidatus Omnitrophota bacterium]MBU1630966.1 magnesium transporter [Candidatus Omnitrophota bacterium]MBU1767450.1 magnesium transporter [Candidatus Omnitrophota bacterium]MBU1889689.1 magnesium transporter [Candidatus Omnitrophota bacterium]
MQNKSIISPEIEEVLKLPNKDEEIRKLFLDLHPREIFTLCEDLKPQQNAQIVIALKSPLGIEFFQQFKTKRQRGIFRHFSKEWMADILEDMAPDERTDFIKTLSKEQTGQVLPLIAQAERNDIKKLLQYKEGTAGSILTTEYAFLSQDITASKALNQLRKQAFDRETIYYVYVIDNERKLLGFISLKDILISNGNKLIKDIMHLNIINAHIDDDKEQVAKKLADYDLLAIPIVDTENRLIGIVTVDDVVDIIEQEHTEDIYKHGAAGDYVDYMGSPPRLIAKHRIIWLLVLVAMGFVSGMVMEKYAYQLQAVVALTFFIPLLCGSGGNAGTQSSTVVIRGLATGEIQIRDVLKIFLKELSIGGIVGLAMGILAAFRALVLNKDPLLAITVGSAMIATVIVATTLGAVLPLLFKKMKLDPALMSGPFIASIVDIVSLLVYFRIAVLVFA